MVSPTPNIAAGSGEYVWLRHFTKLLVVATLGLIFLGGQVKSHEAGLAVPDWPTTYGQNMFLYPVVDWVGGIFHEHLHRLVATSVGILCIVLAGWMWIREDRGWVRPLGMVALGAVIVQGLLGGLTVILYLPAWVSTSHAVLAQSFFMLAIFIAYTQSRERAQRVREARPYDSGAMVKPILILTGIVYLQLIVGALMRHTEAGLAIPDFPAMGNQFLPWFSSETLAWINEWRSDYSFETGNLLPDVTLAQVWIHFVHRAGAVGVLLATGYTLVKGYAHRLTAPSVWRSTLMVAGLVGVQVVLGITTVLTQKVPVITSVHVATGAAILGCVTLSLLRALPLSLDSEDVEELDASVAAIPERGVRT